MLRILKDCIVCGVSVHAGDTLPAVDIPDADIAILIGANLAERFTPEPKQEPEQEKTEPEPKQDQESPMFVEDEPAPAKSRKKSRK